MGEEQREEFAGEEIGRVRLPEDDELFGILLRKLGYGRFSVFCEDGKERTCSVRGSDRRDLWLNERDIVIVEPWPIQGDEKGYIVWNYKPAKAEWLKENGYIEELEDVL